MYWTVLEQLLRQGGFESVDGGLHFGIGGFGAADRIVEAKLYVFEELHCFFAHAGIEEMGVWIVRSCWYL